MSKEFLRPLKVNLVAFTYSRVNNCVIMKMMGEKKGQMFENLQNPGNLPMVCASLGNK